LSTKEYRHEGEYEGEGGQAFTAAAWKGAADGVFEEVDGASGSILAGSPDSALATRRATPAAVRAGRESKRGGTLARSGKQGLTVSLLYVLTLVVIKS